MRTAYYADDGTEFETEDECRQYEDRLHALMHEHQHNGFYVYDIDGDEIDLSAYDLERLEDLFQDVSYIKFNTQRAIDVFLKQSGYYGLCEIHGDLNRPLEVGEHYFYDWDKDRWVCLEDKQRALNEIASIFQ